MENEIREAAQSNNVIIIGDFNFLHIDWINACSVSVRQTKILDMINDCAIDQLVTESTRGEVVNLSILIMPKTWCVMKRCVSRITMPSDST